MKIIVAGDFCPQNRVAELFENGTFDSVLGNVAKYITKTDYSIVNLECPIKKGNEKPIKKCGPNLYSTFRSVEAIKWVGFQGVTLTNNHFLDYGKEGVENVITECKKYGLDMVGGDLNLDEASRILYKTISDRKIAIIINVKMNPKLYS